MKSICKHSILINSWKELTLTALIKAKYRIGEGVAVLVINNSKLSKGQANSKCISPPPPFHKTIDWFPILQAN